ELARHLYVAAELREQPAHDVQPEADAAVGPPVGAVALPEHVEDHGQLLACDADAGVLDGDGAGAFERGAAHDDLALRGELQRVADEVLQDDAELPAVAVDG